MSWCCLKTLDCKFSGFKENEEVIVVAWPQNVLLVVFILSVILVDIFFNIKTCAWFSSEDLDLPDCHGEWTLNNVRNTLLQYWVKLAKTFNVLVKKQYSLAQISVCSLFWCLALLLLLQVYAQLCFLGAKKLKLKITKQQQKQ